ncbi:efflux RND transporter periplasmic adaptor subunit [Danxiaibacter flavus]|uniref:Efflux RND transporter periplasmic adaptor subunit n=1 Tax=Danxiaibacter flavus TaxID=3049108 RepID=A0ABV3ZEA8_9BACT|nr:efflux RND transporter periplasmic adaptor subunit [Chitinophagaceae bacterium DXS]
MKHLSYLSIITTLLLITSCGTKQQKEQVSQNDTIPVKVLELQQQLSGSAIHTSGQFTTDDETNLSFKTGGIVNRVYVKEGDAVSKGQLLATLHQTEISAQVQQAELGYEKAQRDYNRTAALYKDSVATLEQFQNSKTALDIARQQVNAAKFNQNYSEIRATSSGYVLKKFINDGQVVNAGAAVLQINGAHQGQWILKAGISDKEWSVIKTGDKATVKTDALPGQSLDATISKKSEGIDPATGTFTIDITLTGKVPPVIAAGLFGQATINTSQQTKSWTIPYDAILDADAGKAFVFVTNDHKTATRVPVTIAAIDHKQVHINEGLENAQAVIVTGNAYLNDKSPIRIVQ